MAFLKTEPRSYRSLSYLIFIFSLAVIFLLSFREEGGADYQSYKMIFINIENDLESYLLYVEPLQLVLMYFLNFIGAEFWFYNFLLASAVLYINRKACQRLGISYLISHFIYLAVFFVPYSLNGLPQGLSMAVGYFVALFICGNLSRGFLLASIGVFHKSAFITFLFPGRFLPKSLPIWFVLFCIIFLLMPSSLVPTYDFIGEIELTDFLYRIYIVIALIIARFFFVSYSNLYNLGLWWLVASLAILFILRDEPVVALRINMFMRYMEILMVPLAYKHSTKKFKLILLILLCPLYVAIGFSNFTHPTAQIS